MIGCLACCCCWGRVVAGLRRPAGLELPRALFLALDFFVSTRNRCLLRRLHNRSLTEGQNPRRWTLVAFACCSEEPRADALAALHLAAHPRCPAGRAGAMRSGWNPGQYGPVLKASDPPFWRYLLNSTLVGGGNNAADPAVASLRYAPAGGAAACSGKLFGWGPCLVDRRLPSVLLFLALLQLAAPVRLAKQPAGALSAQCRAFASPAVRWLLGGGPLANCPRGLEESELLEALASGTSALDPGGPCSARRWRAQAVLVFLFSWNEFPIRPHLAERCGAAHPGARHGPHRAGFLGVLGSYGAFAWRHGAGSVPLLLLLLVFQRPIRAGLTQGAIRVEPAVPPLPANDRFQHDFQHHPPALHGVAMLEGISRRIGGAGNDPAKISI